MVVALGGGGGLGYIGATSGSRQFFPCQRSTPWGKGTSQGTYS